MFHYYSYDYPIGRITLADNGTSIVGLWFEGQRFYRDILADKVTREKETETVKLAKNWLDRYFGRERPAIGELPIEFIGSDFRKEVWHLLTEIPYGEVTTYGELARKIAEKNGIKTMSAQAIGGAVGRNPISIIVPCHRVVGATGTLTGYAGGIEIKEKLLALEGAYISAATMLQPVTSPGAHRTSAHRRSRISSVLRGSCFR